jgi:hypothetical protein
LDEEKMNRARKIIKSVGCLVLTLTILQGGLSLSFSQTAKQAAPQIPDVSPPLVYDPKRVETLVGEVTEIGLIPNTDGIGLHMAISRWGKRIKVSMVIGPKWFYDQQKFQITVGDLIEVKGTRFDLAGTHYVPYEIKKSDLVMKIYDYQGPRVRRFYETKPAR